MAETASLDPLYRRITGRIAPLIVVAYVAAYLDRVNVGFAKLGMVSELRFSETVYGFGAGVFFLGYFLFEIPSNLAMHRIGARLTLARIMIAWGVLSGATAFVNSAPVFYLLRFLLGAAEAGFFPGVILYLTYWYPPERRGRITAMFMVAIPLSSVLGSLLSGAILQTFGGLAGLSGWRWLFLLEAAPSVVLGLVVLALLNDRPAAARWLSEAEKAALAADLDRAPRETAQHTVRAAFADGRVWLTTGIYFCFIMGLYGISFWLPTLVSELGVKTPLEVGALTAIPYAIAAVGMVLTGRSADRTHERRWHVAIPALLGGAGLALSVLAHGNTVLALAALSLATYGIIACLPLFWSLPTAFLGGAGAAAGIALVNSFGNLAGFASPYLVGWTKDLTHSTAAGMYVLAAFMAAGAALTLLVPAKLVNR